METAKLYYEDSRLREFDARVLECRQEGQHWLVTLDRTAFYPEGGGQAGDTGTLAGVRVLDTQEHAQEVIHFCDGALELVTLDRTAFYPEGGGQAGDTGTLAGVRVLDTQEHAQEVIHFCDGALEPGMVVHGVMMVVHGVIDYDRRFDLMQQHTGEHLLSGLVYEKYGYHNTGFHMGADVITVDFDGIVPPEDLPELERRANEAVFRDIPLECWVPSEQELTTVTYRTKRALPWPVRIVRIPGYDSCACCSVHVQRTGQIGVIKLLSVIRFRTGVRMEMVCGGRALALLNESYHQNQLVSRAFSAKLSETGEAARRMNETVDSLKLELAQLRRQIFAAKADRCRDAGDVLLFEASETGEAARRMNETVDSLKLELAQLRRQIFAAKADRCRDAGDVLLFEADLESADVRRLADAVAECCGGVAAVLSGNDDEGYAYCLVSRCGDLRALGKTMNQALGGRGGGRAEFQQGRLSASRTQIEEWFSGYHCL